ncbi:CBO0543 family protein [Bacillus taeanensis]|uniref:Uncharacterized protein n=1 Tax=Bacillus taeanensis TaxID=273032 RepID=A0A366XR02_9BACI|nr:CBO0543 family protein [Bacillus taeanensis]RBW67948.1 hypothetical protein DS031_19270 [Bacillus taeanensis]
MEQIILWALLIIGISLFFFSLRKPPLKDWLLMFLLSANITTFLGVLVEGEEMLHYPVKFLSDHFDTSILYEYVLFPVICIYFYQTTYHAAYRGIVGQALVYTAALTIVEVGVERYTNLLHYHTWTWVHTFISVFLLMLFLRFMMKLINWKSRM